MQRQNIVVVIFINNYILHDFLKTECYGNLKKACKVHGWSYSTMSKKKLPVTKDGWFIQRIPFL